MKKSVKALMITSIVFVLVSALCLVVPAFLLKDEVGHVMALDTLFIDCFRTFQSNFNFADPAYFTQGRPTTFMFVGLIALAGIIYLIWLIVIIAKKKGKSLVAFFLTLLVTVAAFLIADFYYFNTMYGVDVATHYGPFFSEFTTGGSVHPLISDGQITNLIEILCTKSFGGEHALAGFPVILSICGLASAGLSGVTFLLVIITAFNDMASPKIVKKEYAVGDSKDDICESEPLNTPEEIEESLVSIEPLAVAEETPVEDNNSPEEPIEETPAEEVPEGASEEEKPEEPAGQPIPTVIPQGSTVVINQYFGNNNATSERESVHKETLTRDDVRDMIKDEVANINILSANDVREVVKDEVGKNKSLTADEVREMVREELENANNLKAEDVRMIFREELERLFQPVGEPVEEEATTEEPAPVAEEPKVEEPAPAPVEEPVPVAEEPKNKIIRIPFTQRCEMMSKEQREHFNELKAEIMSYGVKSRISNSGDTFRLHTKTYVKMVVAGKGLKLYLAVDPAKYEGSTIPFNNVGHKAIYKDIPFAFKVKSDLSLRRAKDLIAEAMASGNLTKGEVVTKDYVQEIIDNKDSVEDDAADESED